MADLTLNKVCKTSWEPEGFDSCDLYMGLLTTPRFFKPYYYRRVQLLGYTSPLPVTLYRITFKIGLDFWMTWVKKDDSLTVLRSNIGKIFHNILRSFVSSLLFK